MSRMQDKKDQPTTDVYLGIDVSKSKLDAYVHPHGELIQVPNDKTGIKKLIQACKRGGVTLVALEATGKYHYLSHRMMHEAGLAVAIINPYRSRRLADALGQMAKTDRIDAEVLARFAEMIRPAASPPPTETQQKLRDFIVGRRQLISDVGDIKRQLEVTENPLIRKQMRARIQMCERHQVAIEKEIRAVIASDPALKHRFDILTSIPGLGPITAATLLSDLEELGQINSKQAASLAGVAPMSRDSGTIKGVRMIRGGRMEVRNMLYMCAVGLSYRDGHLGYFYRRLIREGKHPKVALTAVARKLIILANTLIAEDRHWQPQGPKTEL